MKNSSEFLKKHKIIPRISFKPNETRTLKLIDDKQDTITDKQGQQVEGMKYKVLEGKEIKTFFTTAISLISKLAELEPEAIVEITQKKVKGEKGYLTTYQVESVVDTTEGIDDGIMPVDGEMPVIEENESQ